jgi:hypothetical protein
MAWSRRPYFPTPQGDFPIGQCATRTLGKVRTGGTWSYSTNTVGGITRRSHLLINPSWDTSGAIIYRCRRGNGQHGSEKGVFYQDQYAYFVPSSITNSEGEPARSAFAQAVYNWRNVLSESTKIAYYARAARKHISGYNLYIGEYVAANA